VADHHGVRGSVMWWAARPVRPGSFRLFWRRTVANPQPEPNWELLRFQPAVFFGLSPNYDRSDLKRAYLVWLRRYKPERFPAEFQKIQTAYQFLERQLDQVELGTRPGDQASQETGAAVRSPIKSNSFADPPHTGEAPPLDTERLIPLEQRIEQFTPEEVLAQWERQPPLTPGEALAQLLLRDWKRPANEMEFLKDLLVALGRFPDDATLGRLLSEFLRSPAAAKNSREALTILFDQWRQPKGWELSLPLWTALAKQVDNREFHQFLDECLDSRAASRWAKPTSFEFFLTRLMLFRDDADVTLQRLTQFDRVGESEQEDPFHDQRVAVLKALFEYRRHREFFLNGDPVRSRCDEILRAWCDHDSDFDQRLVACCQDLYGNFSLLDQSFGTPFPPDGVTGRIAGDRDAIQAFLWAWTVISGLLQQANCPSRCNQAEMQQMVEECAERVRRMWDEPDYVRLRASFPDIEILASVLRGVRGLLDWLGLSRRKTGVPLVAARPKDLATLYHTKLRPHLVEFFRSCPVQLQELLFVCQGLNIPKQELEELSDLMKVDSALRMAIVCVQALD
jgi:hypothetical protein